MEVKKKILGAVSDLPANLAQFGWKLAVLFSRQILYCSDDFFFSLIHILISNYFFKYETIDTHARAFLALIILAIGWVYRNNPTELHRY